MSGKDLGVYLVSLYIMTGNIERGVSPPHFNCSNCNFGCSNKKDYNRHLTTRKHIMITSGNNDIKNTPDGSICECGKKYKFRSGLSRHKKTCNIQETTPPLENTFVEVADKRDKIIEEILKDSQDMKNLIIVLMKNQQEVVQNNHELMQTNQQLVQKQQENTVEIITGVIKALPPMGNTTNNIHNNTLNFYLTHTCKDAESIHDFTERFVSRSIEFFKDNYRQVASNQVNLATSVYDIMNKCLDEKPQNEKFIQTTDVKNGILYVKEKKKDEQRQLYGEAEFVKHMDGFAKTGTNIEHAINKAFFPMKEEFTELMKMECGNAPDEDNYEDENEYENELNKYKGRVMELKRNMCLQTYNTSTVFDNKHIRDQILARTKRIKDQSMLE